MSGSRTSDLTWAVQLSHSDLQVACFIELTLPGHVAWSANIRHGLRVSMGFSSSICCNGSGDSYCLLRPTVCQCMLGAQPCLKVDLITDKEMEIRGVG